MPKMNLNNMVYFKGDYTSWGEASQVADSILGGV